MYVSGAALCRYLFNHKCATCTEISDFNDFKNFTNTECSKCDTSDTGGFSYICLLYTSPSPRD